ncbi:MAG: tRNA uridine-5-carboxymethylaminomethyl(34) synthesis GTPase MnmE [Bacillota bacterium]
MDTETIAAISTPLGEGGIGIVRISGTGAFKIAQKIFVTKASHNPDYPRSRYLYHGHILDEHNEVIDEVLLSYMKAPHTFTREDTVEINCHSGVLTLRLVLKRVIREGARMAEPGEFTRRAFLNGRIDLSQAEGILHVIRARSEKGVMLAAQNLLGHLYQKTTSVRELIAATLAKIEVLLDFPEEIAPESNYYDEIKAELAAIESALQQMVAGAERSRIYQKGMEAAIIGKPNVGKSSLLNALLRQQRAIVHEVPGTTRDLLEGYLLVGGYPLCLIDTAGIHRTGDPVEKAGIARTRAAASDACMLLVILDGSRSWSDADETVIAMAATGQKMILVVNKSDLEQKLDLDVIQKRFPKTKIVKTAAINSEGIDKLEEAIIELLDQSGTEQSEPPHLMTMRHEMVVSEARQNVESAASALQSQPLEMVSLELRDARLKLGEITGEAIDDAVLDRIFREFCLGK